MKWIDRLFGVSLSLISITSLVVTVTGFAGIPLPPLAARIIAIVNLVSLPVLIYSTIRSLRDKAAQAKTLAAKGKSAAKKAEAPAAEQSAEAEAAPRKTQPKPSAQQQAAKRAAAGNKPKKGKKKKK